MSDTNRPSRAAGILLLAAAFCALASACGTSPRPGTGDGSAHPAARQEKPPVKGFVMDVPQSGKPGPADGEVLVIAHRGFRGIAPENTLAAARKGHEAGAGWWELDVAASSDGVLVVLHDDNLARTTDVMKVFPHREPWTVYDFTLEELGRLDAGSWFRKADPFRQVAAGRIPKAELAGYKGEKVPTLRQALELTRDLAWKVNVEIKDATGHACDAWIVERTAALVEELGMRDSVLISSFNHEYLRRMKQASPGIRIAALVNNPIPNAVRALIQMGAAAYHPNWKYLDRETVRAMREAGIDVNVWTVNEKADMAQLVEWGVTGLITDFPDRAMALARPAPHR